MSRPVRFAVLLPVFLAAALPAQTERYELGLRVKEMERAFEGKRGDAAAHRRALASLQRSVTSFFAMRLGEAGRALDQARRELLGVPASEARQWADALVFRPELRLVDADTRSIRVRVEALYRIDTDAPADAGLAVSCASLPARAAVATTALGELPTEFVLPLGSAGDQTYGFAVTVAGQTVRSVTLVLSMVPGLERRLRGLSEGAAALPADRSPVEVATLQGHLDTLQALRTGKPSEADVRAHALLDEAEALLRALQDGKPFFAGRSCPDVATSFALRIPVAKASVPVVVHVPPPDRADRKVPLVVALHGAGGSENLFVEGYGNGLAVRLCHERGWILAAPRNASANAVPRLVDQLAALWPVDRERVFLLGHSMGAMTAVAAACAAPQLYRGVAALGGGGAVRAQDGLVRLPFFVAAGSADFGRNGGLLLVRALRKAEVTDVRWREYPDIEHLVIVQAALPDVFQFFDGGKDPSGSAPATQGGGRSGR